MPPVSLGQAAGGSSIFEPLLWSVILIAVALVGFLALSLLRRWLHQNETADQGTLLDTLRAARDTGRITDDEFEEARLRLLSHATGRSYDDLRRASIERAGGVVARPGHDLTGQPLPVSHPDPQTGPPASGGSGHDKPGEDQGTDG